MFVILLHPFDELKITVETKVVHVQINTHAHSLRWPLAHCCGEMAELLTNGSTSLPFPPPRSACLQNHSLCTYLDEVKLCHIQGKLMLETISRFFKRFFLTQVLQHMQLNCCSSNIEVVKTCKSIPEELLCISGCHEFIYAYIFYNLTCLTQQFLQILEAQLPSAESLDSWWSVKLSVQS